MTIETKYNLGDKVFYLESGCVLSGKITSVSTYHTKNSAIINYEVDGSVKDYPQSQLFKTKQELLDSL